MENLVYAKPYNETFILVNSNSESVLREIQQHFTFDVPNAKFSPLYKKGRWDGKIKLLNLRNKTLYKGLLPQLKQYCVENDLSLAYEPELGNSIKIPPNYSNILFEKLRMASDGKELEIRPYQYETVQQCLSRTRNLILSPTSSGKSAIIYALVRQYVRSKFKVLIIVPTVQLVRQLFSDFEDYSTINGWDVESNTHKIYAGQDKESDKKVIISTWQSLLQIEDIEYFQQFDAVINDEVHLADSKSISSIMELCTNAKYRMGCTGSLKGGKTHQMVLEGLFGPLYQSISTSEMIEKGYASDLEIKCIVLKHTDEVRKAVSKIMSLPAKQMDGKKKYQHEINFLCAYSKRNKFIANLALSREGNTIVFFNFVEKHGEILYNLINDLNKDPERKIFYIQGGIDGDEREDIRKIIETETNAILVASYGTSSTGINIKNLHNMIFALSYKSVVRNLQSIGRGLRLGNETKTKCTLYDISDNLKYRKSSKDNYGMKHFQERMNIYMEQEFKFTTTEINL